ncbi:DUF3999 domain-containing protein [Pseudomonas vanderleydeniana]|uniref:DUF3999 domain-containing protein n=1 Tax=Pseudomonas vanderleydeniana TaxID=2745495 RepID=A0A9E6TSS3_9PSED|nr:DUF3999 domain-containing protein [Pseudomonas vanderleydeniana]QXI28901.1 DUF3999 domain-containing protein [Pseudomonas vanderleydeniana]
MIRKLSPGCLGVVLLCLSASLLAQEKPADYSTVVPLTLGGEGPWYRLELPLALQAQARQADLNDVRVFNSAGEPQAYALLQEQAQSTQQRSQTDVKWFPLYSSADAPQAAPSVRVQSTTSGTLVEVTPSSHLEAGEEVLRGWLLDASAIKAPLQQLLLDWTSERDGFQRFSIEASDDLQHWQAWGDGQVARLSFADERIEQREVSLPGQSARYLRLLWQSPQSAPVLNAAQLVSSTSSLSASPLAWSQPLAGSTAKSGEYTWTLPTGLNLEQVRIDLAQPNSLAPAQLYGRRSGNEAWQALGSGLLYRLTQGGQDVLQNTLELPGYTVAQLKLVVDERGGGLGATAPALSYAVRPTQLVFLARGNAPFSLALGNPTVAAANLPLSTLIPDYGPQRLASIGRATAGAAQVVAPSAPATTAAPATDWKKIGLWAVLLLGVAALGGMAFSLLRKPQA